MITFDFNVSHLLDEIFTMKKILSQLISQRKIIIPLGNIIFLLIFKKSYFP